MKSKVLRATAAFAFVALQGFGIGWIAGIQPFTFDAGFLAFLISMLATLSAIAAFHGDLFQ